MHTDDAQRVWDAWFGCDLPPRSAGEGGTQALSNLTKPSGGARVGGTSKVDDRLLNRVSTCIRHAGCCQMQAHPPVRHRNSHRNVAWRPIPQPRHMGSPKKEGGGRAEVQENAQGNKDLSGTILFLPTLWVFTGWRPCCLIFAN